LRRKMRVSYLRRVGRIEFAEVEGDGDGDGDGSAGQRDDVEAEGDEGSGIGERRLFPILLLSLFVLNESHFSSWAVKSLFMAVKSREYKGWISAVEELRR
jgi:hypothetical protein